MLLINKYLSYSIQYSKNGVEPYGEMDRWIDLHTEAFVLNKVSAVIITKLAIFYGKFCFLYTNNDVKTNFISARIFRKAPQNGTF